MKRMLSRIILALLMINMVVSASMSQSARSSPSTLTVPDDYPTIKVAINAASPGDTVYVKAGIYNESLWITTTLSLVGENPQNTIIDGGGHYDVLEISADSVVVTGFTIRNSGSGMVDFAGIGLSGDILNHINHCDIYGNDIIANTGYGVFLPIYCDQNTIHDNNITANSYSGVLIESSSENTVNENNIAENSQNGILEVNGHDNSVVKNDITANKWNGVSLGDYCSSVSQNNIIANGLTGISLKTATNNSIIGNEIEKNREGVSIVNSANNTFYHNNLVSNMQQVSTVPLPNIWDNGYPSGGNYWSDYATRYPNATEIDTSGIGDTPYVITTSNINIDHYPLMRPYAQSTPAATYDVTITAHCNTEDTDINVAVRLDGLTKTYSTPYTFTELSGTHTLTVADSDTEGHAFKNWTSGQTTTAITVSTGGIYICNYEARISRVITGVIFEDLNLNGIPDEGEGLNGATVTINNPAYGPLPNEPFFTTNSTGEYTFDVTIVTDGVYTIFANKNSYQPWYATVQLRQQNYITVNIDLMPLANKMGTAEDPSQGGFGPDPVNGFVSNGKDMLGSFTSTGTLCYLFYPYIGQYEQINYHVQSQYLYGHGHAPVQTSADEPWMGSFPGVRLITDSGPIFFWLTNNSVVTQRQYHPVDSPSNLVTQYFVSLLSNSELYVLNITETALIDNSSATLIRNFEVHNLGNNIDGLDFVYYASFDINKADRGGLGDVSAGHYHSIYFDSSEWSLKLEWDWPYATNEIGFTRSKYMYWTDQSDGTSIVLSGDKDNSIQNYYIGSSGKPGNPSGDSAYSHCVSDSGNSPETEYDLTDNTGNGYIEWNLHNLTQNSSTSITVYITAGNTLDQAIGTMSASKTSGFSVLLSSNSGYWNSWLQKARTEVESGKINYPELYLDGLLEVKMLQEQDGPKPGAIIMSPSLQPEYCYSWPRDGTFGAVALDLAGYDKEASLWYDFLKTVQRTDLDSDLDQGYWYMCYHPDGSYAGTADWYKQEGLPGLTLPFAGPESDQQGIVLWGLSVHYDYAFGSDVGARDRWLAGFNDTITLTASYIKDKIWYPSAYSWRDGLLFPATDKDEEVYKFEQSIWANSACYAGLIAATKMGFEGFDAPARDLANSMYKIFYKIGQNDMQSLLKTLSYDKGDTRMMLGIRNPSEVSLKSTDFADAFALSWPFGVSTFDSAIEGWFTQIGANSGNWKVSNVTWSSLFFTIYSAIHSGPSTTDYYGESLMIPALSATGTGLISEGSIYMPEYDGVHDTWGKNFADGRRAIGLVWSEGMFITASLARIEQLQVSVHSPVDLHVYDPYHQHTGLSYTTGHAERGIPYSDYSGRKEPQSIIVTFPVNGTYVIELVGEDNGPFKLDVTLSTVNSTTTASYAGQISKGAVQAFAVDTSTSVSILKTLNVGTPVQDPPSGVQANQEVTVSVNVTDNSSPIKNVTLLYTIDNGTVWNSLTMTEEMAFDNSTSLYQGVIWAQGEGKLVNYRILVYDQAGNWAGNDNAGHYFNFVVIAEFPPGIVSVLFFMLTLSAVIAYRITELTKATTNDCERVARSESKRSDNH